MKPSAYTYLVENGDKVIFFNGISEKFFEISKNNASSVNTVISNPNDNYDTFGPFIEKLTQEGFIIGDDVDELKLIMKKIESSRRLHEYELMVLPTYQCNLHCWYCPQHHAELWMSDDVLDRIKNRIKIMLDKEDISTFHLSWFGGEPLLAYDKVVMLTRFAQTESKKRNVRFYSSVTTNATLLNEDRITELNSLGVISYQITIDGDKGIHDKIKMLKNTSAYDIAVRNVNIIGENRCRCVLRFNYTHDNLKPESVIRDINSRLSENAKKYVQMHLQKVWQEPLSLINKDDVADLVKRCVKTGISISFSHSQLCYVDRKYFECVFPDGRIGKCDNQDHSNIRVFLKKDGSLSDESIINDSYNIDFPEMKICRECRYLPFCMGPCYVKREKMLKDKGFVACKYDSADDGISDEIRSIVLNHNAVFNHLP